MCRCDSDARCSDCLMTSSVAAVQTFFLLLAVQRAERVLPRAVGVQSPQPQLHGRLKAQDCQAHCIQHRQVGSCFFTSSRVVNMIYSSSSVP